MSQISVADFSVADSKRELRALARARRGILSHEQRGILSHLTCGFLKSWLESRRESPIAVYLAHGKELSIDLLIEELLARNIPLCAPRGMGFARLESLEKVEIGAFGVREPLSARFKRKIQPQIALVPGLAFDSRGTRLGQGGGWYDRVLGEIPIRVGVCFSAQIFENLPRESHDIPMNFLATTHGVDETIINNGL